jgi:hypothetical protein
VDAGCGTLASKSIAVVLVIGEILILSTHKSQTTGKADGLKDLNCSKRLNTMGHLKVASTQTCPVDPNVDLRAPAFGCTRGPSPYPLQIWTRSTLWPKSVDRYSFSSGRDRPVHFGVPGQFKKNKMYEMTKDGFVFLAMGFTGPEAGAFKEAYIVEFNRMEAACRKMQ